MESTEQRPTASEASAALDDAVASRATLAKGLRTPPLFFTSIGVAIALQIALTAVAVTWSVGAGGITSLMVRPRKTSGGTNNDFWSRAW